MDRINFVKSYIQQGQAKQQQAQAQEAQSRADYYQAAGAQRQEDATDAERIGKMVNDYMQTHARPGETTGDSDDYSVDSAKRPFNPQELMTGVMAAGVKPRNLNYLSEAMKNLAGYGADKDIMPKETTIGGRKFVVNPKTGTFQAIDTEQQPQPLADEDGKVFARPVPDGKGGFKYLQVKASGPRFKAIPSLTDPTGFATTVEADTPEDLQRGMELLKKAKDTGSPATAQTNFDPLPTDRTKWQKGQTYLTNKGPLQWDGNVFIPVSASSK
jgi:hypothetical protein